MNFSRQSTAIGIAATLKIQKICFFLILLCTFKQTFGFLKIISKFQKYVYISNGLILQIEDKKNLFVGMEQIFRKKIRRIYKNLLKMGLDIFESS